MKSIQKTILGLGLLTSSIYAQDVSNKIHSPGYIKDYSVNINFEKQLIQGNNEITIKFIHKTHTHNDLKAKLIVFSPDGTDNSYKGINTKSNGRYLYNVSLKEKGTYKYSLSFGHNVGIIHNKRGSFIVN